ncbi:beta strand repeat-containing protein, partial [Methanobacterium sp.]|uniref:beta strand repeat-containing protein n=1 Tax=Methanobacterium sp. TaxID=2164 RepID=UPI003C77275C
MHDNHKYAGKGLTLVFLFSIVFAVLSTVNTVSADQSMIYVSDLIGDDDWNGESSIWDELTSSGPKKSIKNATGTVTNGGTINIANGRYLGENNTNISICKNMTIVGQSRENTIINGTNSAQIFTIQKGVSVTIKNLTFVNGTATQNLTIADKNITSGGAICNFGNLTVLNSTFRGNAATSNDISKEHAVGGGAIYNVGDLTIKYSDFINNVATGNLIGNNGTMGGAIFNIGNLTVDSSNFTGNNATAGGAIYNIGILTILNSIFTGNIAAGNIAAGGAIYNEYSSLNLNGGILNISGSTFTGNHAEGNGTSFGGAIASERGSSIKNSTFTSNKAISTNDTAMGGAIFSYGNLTVITSKFGLDALTGNTATGKNNASMGGAIITYGNLTVNWSQFNYNNAYYGGAISNWGNLTVNYTNFTANIGMGGALFNNGNSTIINSIFANNKATSTIGSSIGGAILNAGILTVNNCKFNGNTATNGGAICNDYNATIINSIFTSNKVASTDNTVENYGGAIYNEGKLNVSGSTFTGNKATSTNTMNLAYGGGAISNFNEAIVKTSKFSGNIADFGGAISNMGKLNISGSTFTGNRAVSASSSYAFDGGAISNNCNLTVTSSTFTGNIADLGGVISNWGNSTTIVLGSTLTSNNATSDGAAIYNEGKLTVNFCRIIGNLLKVPTYVSSTGYVLDDVDSYNGSANVKYNWWGSNAGPSSGRVHGVTSSPWMVLTLSASPTTIKAGGTSTVSANFLYDSNGVYHSYSSGHVPDGMTVGFTTKFGTIGSKAYTVNGIAKSTLKAGSAGGIVNVSAKADSQTVQIPLKVISTYPKNYATGCSRTATIYLKFSG